MNKFIAPDFKDNEKFWLEIWRSVNFHWEKLWKERPEITDRFSAWWVGNHAGKLFRLREISGMDYSHGEIMCGPTSTEKDNENSTDL